MWTERHSFWTVRISTTIISRSLGGKRKKKKKLPSASTAAGAAGTAINGPRHITTVLVLRARIGAVAVAIVGDTLLGAV